jgi:glycosyltransferase involved in cell wall biosynthesis
MNSPPLFLKSDFCGVVRIGIDLTPVLPGSANGGAKFAALEFVRILLNDFSDRFHLTLFLPEIAIEELQAYFPGHADLKCTRFGRQRINALSEAIEELKNQSRIRAICRENSIRIFYSPFGRFIPLPFSMPFVAQVHDLIHLDYPETMARQDRVWRHFNLVKLALRRAIFQVSSEFTRQRLHKAYSVPLERIHRIYLPIHGRFSTEKTACENPYFLYPARAWPHKNHENLLHAHHIYRKKLGQRAWKLVLTAGDDKRSERLRSLALALGSESDLTFLGEVDEQELNRIYQSASALVFPSRYEGFGIPLIEAMHSGLPIICGRGGSQLEVAGEAAIYVDVEDPEDIAGAMARLTEDIVLREQLVAKGKRQLQSFVLRAEIGKLIRIFEKCSGSKFSPGGPLQQFSKSLAILFLDFLYATSVLWLSATTQMSNRFLRLKDHHARF